MTKRPYITNRGSSFLHANIGKKTSYTQCSDFNYRHVTKVFLFPSPNALWEESSKVFIHYSIEKVLHIWSLQKDIGFFEYVANVSGIQ